MLCTSYRILIFRPYKRGPAKMASPRVPHFCREVSDSYYTFISRFSRGLFWDTPSKNVKILKWLTTLIPANYVLEYSSGFFLCRNIVKSAASIFPSTPWTPCCMARRSVREVKQFRKVRVIHIYTWCDSANLLIHEVKKGKVTPLQARRGPEGGGERYSSTLPWPRH